MVTISAISVCVELGAADENETAVLWLRFLRSLQEADREREKSQLLAERLRALGIDPDEP